MPKYPKEKIEAEMKRRQVEKSSLVKMSRKAGKK